MIKILACQIYFRKKDNKIVDINIKKFLEEICKIDKSKRTSYSNIYSPILIDIKKIFSNNKVGLTFYKYREGEKPYIETETGDLTQLEDTLVELTSGYLDESNNILYLQQNYHGLNTKKIEKYLNEFIVDKSIRLFLEPIYKDFALNLIYNSDRIKEIFLKMNSNILSYDDKKNNILSSIVNKVTESDINEKKALELKISAGRNRRFNGEVVKELVEFTQTDENIEDVLIEYKDKNGEYKKESINKLKDDLYFVILKNEKRKNIGWEYILDEIYANYNKIETKAIETIQETLLGIEEAYYIPEIKELGKIENNSK